MGPESLRLRCLLALLIVATTACARTSDARVIQRVLESQRQESLHSYRFEGRPYCQKERDSERCRAHEPDVVRVARSMMPGPAREGWRLRLSPVRDSARVKVVLLLTSIDSVSPDYGSASLQEVVVDRRGDRVLSKRMLMGEITARPMRLDSAQSRVSGEYVAAAALASRDTTGRQYLVVDSASLATLPRTESSTYRELRTALGDADTIGIAAKLPQCGRASGRACIRVVVVYYEAWPRGALVGVALGPPNRKCEYPSRHFSVRRQPNDSLSTTVEMVTEGNCGAR
jgi:hypothetical protein